MATLSECWDWKVEPVSREFASTDHDLDVWDPEDDVIFDSPNIIKDEPSHHPNSPYESSHPNSPYESSHPNSPYMYSQSNSPKVLDYPNSSNNLSHPNSLNMLTYPNSPDILSHPNSPDMLSPPNSPDMLSPPNSPDMLSHPNSPDILRHPNSPDMLSHPNSPDMLSHPNSMDTLTPPNSMEMFHHTNSTDAFDHSNSPEILRSPLSPSFFSQPNSPSLSDQNIKDELNTEMSPIFLEDMDNLKEWIKEEPFADWLEEKIDLPTLEVITPDASTPVQYSELYGNNILPVSEAYSKNSTNLDLRNVILTPHYEGPEESKNPFQDFEYLLGKVEHNHGALTPPGSPPQSPFSGVQNEQVQNTNDNQFVFSPMQQMAPDFSYKPQDINISLSINFGDKKEPLLQNLEQIVPSTPAPDIVQELAAVEELIRTRCEALETDSEEPTVSLPWNSNVSNVEQSRVASPCQPSPQSQPVIPLSPSTSSSSFDSGEELCDDPDWIPTSEQPSSPACYKTTGSRRRAKPYTRVGTEEKRLRKKEQNKNAATRYRQKKKAEVEVIMNEEKDLMDKREELETQVTDLSREIKYLKGLMRDVFRAKGLIK